MIVYFMIIYIGRPRVIIKNLNKNCPQAVDRSNVQMLCCRLEFLNVRDYQKGLHDKDDNWAAQRWFRWRQGRAGGRWSRPRGWWARGRHCTGSPVDMCYLKGPSGQKKKGVTVKLLDRFAGTVIHHFMIKNFKRRKPKEIESIIKIF